MFATHYFACTEHAGRWLFGNKTFEKGKVTIINNGIDIEQFLFNEKIRNEKRNEMGIKHTDIVIGHVGRFIPQKNHKLVINIFYELYKKNNNYKLLLIGQGPLQNKIKEKVKRLKIEDSVTFLGQKKDVNKYYQAMDLFLFPSLYEGLGIAVIEAQTSGLPCIVSTEVPLETKVSEKISFISLKKADSIWIETINKIIEKDRDVKINRLIREGFSIMVEAKKLENIYITLFYGRKNGNTKRFEE